MCGDEKEEADDPEQAACTHCSLEAKSRRHPGSPIGAPPPVGPKRRGECKECAGDHPTPKWWGRGERRNDLHDPQIGR